MEPGPNPAHVTRVTRSVLGEELVELLAGVRDDRNGPLDLRRVRGDRDLLGREVQLPHRGAQVMAPLGVLPREVPRCPAGLLDAPGELGATRLVDLEDPLAVTLGRLHQSLVLEQLERRVHGAGTRAPRAPGLVLERLHHVVAVAGTLGERREQRRADVPAPHAPPAFPRRAAVPAPVTTPATSPGASAFSSVVHQVPPSPSFSRSLASVSGSFASVSQSFASV